MLHGVYVHEDATPVVAPRTTTTGIQFVVGTAPVHKTENPQVNKLVLCKSLSDATQKLGYSEDFANYTLCQSMYMNFSVIGVSPTIFVNVFDPATHRKSFTTTGTLTDGRAVIDEADVLLDTVTVSTTSEDDPPVTTTYTRGTDYVTAYDAEGKLVISRLSTGSMPTSGIIDVGGYQADPTAVTANDVIGGVDANGVETGLALLRRVYPQLGITAATIIAPGWSHNPTVGAAIAAACEEINGVFRAECVLDLNSSSYTKISQVPAAKAAAGYKNKHAYLVWPMVKVGGKKIYASANVAAVAQANDYANGGMPNVSPSNKAAYIDAAVLADGTEIYLDAEEGNIANEVGVGTYINTGGIYRIWGNYSAAYPDNQDPKDKFWNIRRFFTWHANSFITNYFSRIDEPMNRKQIEAIVDAENIVMNGYVASGACAAASIEISEENTSATIMEGTLYFRQKLAVYTPLQAIVNTISFDPEALTSALTA